MNSVVNNSSSKLINKILIESRWLMVGLVAILLSLALWSFNREDPSWSHAFAAVHTNALGKFGAIISDILYYSFGLSAWWWVVFLIFIAWRGLERFPFLNRFVRNTRPLFLLIGFIVVVCSSSGLEHLRFHSYASDLPFAAGGIVGMVCANFASSILGYTGATLLLLISLIIGWQIFSGMSWVLLSERIGTFLENTFNFYRRIFEYWQDRRIGRETTLEREEKLRQERLRVQDLEPIIISTTPAPVELATKVIKQIEKEKRNKELTLQESLAPKQQQLFDFNQEFLTTGETTNISPPSTNSIPNIEITQVDNNFVQLSNNNKTILPSVTLLDPPPSHLETPSIESLEFTSRLIERKLAEFRVEVKVISASPGPVVTRYEIEPAVGVKGSQIMNLERDLARALSLVSVRIVDTVPGKPYMALELPNNVRHVVKLIEIIGSKIYQENYSNLTICLGKDISGNPVIADLAKMPHLLVAGTTGSGKSVGVNAMILSLLFKSTPEQVRMIMIDPKMLEFSIYEGIPHLLTPVVTDMKQAAGALNWCVAEMEKRYRLMSALGVRNISGLNEKIRQAQKNQQAITNPFSINPDNPEPLAYLPFIVVVIDELADLMMVVGKKVEELIARLAQKARAAGIHLVLATQRPSVDVITGLIKANIPSRLSFQVSSKIDSRTIIDQMGAESLLGQGDMLFLPSGSGYPMRVHGAYVSDDEVHRIVNFLKENSSPDYIDEILNSGVEALGEVKATDSDGEKDPLYDRAVEIVVQSRRASTSLVQRHLRVGYNRAARLVESMEEAGIVTRADERGAREVIAKPVDENL